jgi:hypothetical protein
VDLAKSDLSKRTGVPVAKISVVSSEAVEWPNSALGCPEPGMVYAQVITPGRKVVLNAGGKTYEYHTGDGRAVTCQK